MFDFQNISSAVRQTSFGVWVIDKDTHFTKWIEEERRLDHHGGFLVDLLPFIPDGGVVIDIGAYIGDHTIAYINKAGPSGVVYAFEPNPVAFFCLTKNCPSAKSYMVGVGARPSFSSYVAVEGNVGASHLARDTPGGIPIPLIDIDSLRIDRLHFAKIDVEGHEAQALYGMRQTIARTRPVLCVEITKDYQEAQGSSISNLFSHITDMGYVIRRFHDHSWDDPQYDILAIPVEAVGSADIERMPTKNIADLVNRYRAEVDL